ncbi:Protein roller-3 [Trichinella nelsoni]|uniref:acylphosphatase n=1 Tax=Trichinella nelsoni TaxID=6336 RepID=A0A0V0SA42_9BILA|nr:Protein roller-3 [Trichinella nelsoni]
MVSPELNAANLGRVVGSTVVTVALSPRLTCLSISVFLALFGYGALFCPSAEQWTRASILLQQYCSDDCNRTLMCKFGCTYWNPERKKSCLISCELRLVAMHHDRLLARTVPVQLSHVSKSDLSSALLNLHLVTVRETQAYVSWNPSLVEQVPELKFQVELRTRATNELLIYETVNFSYYMFSNLIPGHAYECTVRGAVSEKTNSAVGLSGNVVFETHSLVDTLSSDLMKPMLLYASQSTVSMIKNVDDFLLKTNPTPIFEDKAFQVAALAYGEGDVFIASRDGQIVKFSIADNSAIQRAVLLFSLLTHIQAIGYDFAKQQIFVLSNTQIILCKLNSKRCQIVLRTAEIMDNIVVDSINGYLYGNSGWKLFRAPLANVEALAEIDIPSGMKQSFDDKLKLSIDHPAQLLVIQVNGSVMAYSLTSNRLENIRLNKLHPDSRRSYDSFVKFQSWQKRLFWISSPCVDALNPADGSCIYSEENNPNNGLLNIHNYLLPVNHGKLVDLVLLAPMMRYSLLPAPSNLSAFFTSNSVRMIWNIGKPFPFQAQLEWREFNFEIEITDNDQMVYRQAGIDQLSFVYSGLSSGRRYLLRVRACLSVGHCSNWAELSGTTYSSSWPEDNDQQFSLFSQDQTVLRFDLAGNVRNSLQASEQPIQFITMADGAGEIFTVGDSLVKRLPQNELVTRLQYAEPISAIAYEPFGQEMYWTSKSGIFRQSLKEPNLLKISSDGLIQWFHLMPKHGLVVLGSCDHVYTLYLTGMFHRRYFSCDNVDCQILGVSVSEDADSAVVYYLVEQGDSVVLNSVDVKNEKINTLAKADAFNSRRNIWTEIKVFYVVNNNKLVILSRNGQLMLVESDLQSVSVYPFQHVVHITRLLNSWPYNITWSPPCCLTVDLKLGDPNEPRPFLQWNDTSSDNLPSDVPFVKYYNLSMLAGEKNNEKLVSATITKDNEIPIGADILEKKDFNVQLMEIALWRRAHVSKAFTAPDMFPLPPAQTALNVVHIKNPFNITADVIFSWTPVVWNGKPKFYKIYCWRFDGDSTNRTYLVKGREIDWRSTRYDISRISQNWIVYCSVSAVNANKGESKRTVPISVVTSENSPPSIILIVTSSGLYQYHVDFERVLDSTISGPYKAATYGKDFIYAIRNQSEGDYLVKFHSYGLAVIEQLPLSKYLSSATLLTYDWIGERVLLVGRSRQHGHIQGDSIYVISLDNEAEPRSLFTTHPGYEILSIAYNPMDSHVYFVESFGGKYSLKSWLSGSDQLVTFECVPSSPVFSMTFLNPASVEPTSFMITGNGIADSKNCTVIIDASHLHGVEMNAVVSIGHDVNHFYLVERETLRILNRKRLEIVELSFTGVRQVLSTSPQYQPFPDIECMKLPSTVKSFTVTSLSNTGVLIACVLSDKPSDCGNVTDLPINYELKLSPQTKKNFEDIRQSLIKESRSVTFHVEGLVPGIEYMVKVKWWNRFTKPKIYEPGPLSFYTSYLIPVQNLDAFPIAPDKVQLLWIPFIDADNNQPIPVDYRIVMQNYENNTLQEVVSCSTNPCQYLFGNLDPSTLYFVQAYAIDLPKQSNMVHEQHNVAASSAISVTTFDLPVRYDEKDFTSSHTSIAFQLIEDISPSLQQITVEYQLADETLWHVIEASWVEKEKRGYRIDNLKQNQAFLFRAHAKYSTNRIYMGTLRSFPDTFNQQLPPLATKGQAVQMSLKVELVQLDGKKHLKWKILNNEDNFKVQNFIISYRANSNVDWVKFAVLPSTTWSTLVPEPVSNVDRDMEFRVEAVVDDNVIMSGYWQPNTENSLSPAVIAAVVFISILLTALIFIIVICTIRRKKLSRHMSRMMPEEKKPTFVPNTPEVLDQLPAEDLNSLPHIPRSCISIVRELGRGAFGEVYEGLAYNLPKFGPKSLPVAVKTLRPGSTYAEKVRFIKEAILMSHFDHPNIVALRGVCFETEPHWIILELMEAGDLLKYLRSVRATNSMPSQVSLKDLLCIAIDVARGCTYLEEIHHVHRDLAARNCLITSRNPAMRVVKIGDFGMTRDVYEEDYYRVEGHGLLPVRWMAPESMIDGVFTTKTDVWSSNSKTMLFRSFAVLLWEVMTLGKQPYSGRSNWDVLNYVRIGGRLEKPPSCPIEMFEIMLACWAFEAKDRPAFSALLYRLMSLLDLPEYNSDQPFPQFNGISPMRHSTDLTSGNLNSSYSDDKVQVCATRSSARFFRGKNSSSVAEKTKSRGSSFRSLRKKKKEPAPPLPSKEEVNMPPDMRLSTGRPASQVSSSGTESMVLFGSDAYEIPLIRNLSKSARSELKKLNASEPQYHHNFALDIGESSPSEQSSYGPAVISRLPEGSLPPVPCVKAPRRTKKLNKEIPVEENSKTAAQFDDTYENVRDDDDDDVEAVPKLHFIYLHLLFDKQNLKNENANESLNIFQHRYYPSQNQKFASNPMRCWAVLKTVLISSVLYSRSINTLEMSKSLLSVDFEVFGKVQGVFFRKSTVEKAKDLGLVGWCQNTKTGTVIGQVEGPKNEVNEMKIWLEKVGSPSSRIDKAVFKNEKEISTLNFNSFDVKRASLFLLYLSLLKSILRIMPFMNISDFSKRELCFMVCSSIIPASASWYYWKCVSHQQNIIDFWNNLEKPKWDSLLSNTTTAQIIDIVVGMPLPASHYMLYKFSDGFKTPVSKCALASMLIFYATYAASALTVCFQRPYVLNLYRKIEAMLCSSASTVACFTFQVSKLAGLLILPTLFWYTYNAIFFLQTLKLNN